jgi:hypothetical protein
MSGGLLRLLNNVRLPLLSCFVCTVDFFRNNATVTGPWSTSSSTVLLGQGAHAARCFVLRPGRVGGARPRVLINALLQAL